MLITTISPINGLIYIRIVITVVLGIIFTYFLRWLIRRFGLLPPLPIYKLPMLAVMIGGSIVLYAFVNSAIVEWLHLYERFVRISMARRMMANIMLDAPLFLVWVCLYYTWHYMQLGTTMGKNISELEKLAKQKRLELGFSEP